MPSPTTTTTSSSSAIVVAVSVVVSTISTAVAVYAVRSLYQTNDKMCKLSAYWEARRNEERKGRRRAEIQLRTLVKQQQQQQQHQKQQLCVEHEDSNSSDPQQQQQQLEQQASNANPTNDDENNNGCNTILPPAVVSSLSLLTLQCIGIVVSPYTKRVGTPRQGALVPSSRGYIDVSSVPTEFFHGLDQYSHVWIIFGFHANTNIVIPNNPNSNNSNNNHSENHNKIGLFAKYKTKIRPPRAPPSVGKVGQLATRSPHRPNPIGLSLVKLESLDVNQRRIHISGLDLVHGTPVYDIKPFVPWDIPGYFIWRKNETKPTKKDKGQCVNDDKEEEQNHATNRNKANNTATQNDPRYPTSEGRFDDYYQVPDWVASDDDELSHVTFTPQALEQLHQAIQNGRLAPFYTYTNNYSLSNINGNDVIAGGIHDADDDDAGVLQAAREALEQILAQDPRSSHRGLKNSNNATNNNMTQSRRGSSSMGKESISTATAAAGANASTLSVTLLSPSSSPSKNITPYRLYFGNAGVDFIVQQQDRGVLVMNVVPVDFPADAYMDGIPLASLLDRHN